MDKKVDLITYGVYLGKVGYIGLMLYYNEYSRGILFLCLFLIGLWTIEVKYLFAKKYKSRYAVWLIEYGMILVICSREYTGMSVVLMLLRVGSIVSEESPKVGIVMTIISYIGYVITRWVSFGEEFGGLGFFMTTMNFMVTYILVIAIRYQIVQREKSHKIAKELVQKTEELEKAYQKLQDFYQNQEEMILLKERNRIAGEIHDTVGHRLTTAIVQLEASKRLIDSDVGRATEKLLVAQNQVREGLQDIRQAVKAMKEESTTLPFSKRIKVFIQEVAENSDIKIMSQIADLPTMNSKIEDTLFRALQEGITNGIRHGKSNWFEIEICCEKDIVQLTLKNRGIVSEKITYGFGLSNMERKIKELEGKLEIISQKDKGITLIVNIPMKEEPR